MDEKRYCVQCKKETAKDTQQCECGCRTFAFGSVKVNEEGKWACVCGNEALRCSCHMDFTDKAVNTFQCTACGAAIGTEYYRDAEEMMYWGD
jgi:hypothetical protein